MKKILVSLAQVCAFFVALTSLGQPVEARDAASNIEVKIANLNPDLSLTDETDFWTGQQVPAAVDLRITETGDKPPAILKLRISFPKKGNYTFYPTFGSSEDASSIVNHEDNQNWYRTYVFHNLYGGFRGTYQTSFVFRKDMVDNGDQLTIKAEVLDGTNNDKILKSIEKTYTAKEIAYEYNDSAVLPYLQDGHEKFDPNQGELHNTVALYNVSLNELTKDQADTGDISERDLNMTIYYLFRTPANVNRNEVEYKSAQITAIVKVPEGFEPEPNGQKKEDNWDPISRTFTTQVARANAQSTSYRVQEEYFNGQGYNWRLNFRATSPKIFDTIYEFPVEFYVNKGTDKEVRLPDRVHRIKFKKKVSYWYATDSFLASKRQIRGNQSVWGQNIEVSEGTFHYYNGKLYGNKNAIDDDVSLLYKGFLENTNNGSSRQNSGSGGKTTAIYAIQDFRPNKSNSGQPNMDDQTTYYKYFGLDGFEALNTEYYSEEIKKERIEKLSNLVVKNKLYGVAADGSKTLIKENIGLGEKVAINDDTGTFLSLSLEFDNPIVLDNMRLNYWSGFLPSTIESAKFDSKTYGDRQRYFSTMSVFRHHGLSNSHPLTSEGLTPTSPSGDRSSITPFRPNSFISTQDNQIVQYHRSGTDFRHEVSFGLNYGTWGPLRGETRTVSLIKLLPIGYHYHYHHQVSGHDLQPRFIENYRNTGKTAIIYPNVKVRAGDNRFLISTQLKISKEAVAGESTIENYLVYDQNDDITPVQNPSFNNVPYTDALDLDEDGNRQETFVKVDRKITYVPPLELNVTKTVTYDNLGSMGSTATGELGQPFYYKLAIHNNTVDSVNAVTMMDSLPYKGDHSVSPDFTGKYAARSSTFETPMQAFLEDLPENSEAASLFDFYYQVDSPGETLDSLKNGTWFTKDEVGDPSRVKSFKYSLKAGKQLKAQQTVNVYIKALLPKDKNLTKGSYAYNSGAGSREGISFIETNKVGITFATYDLSGIFFNDLNKNGIKEPSEEGLANRQVELIDEHGNPVLDLDNQPITTATDENGKYQFNFHKGGQYRVRFTKKDDEVFSPITSTSITGNNIQTSTDNQGTTIAFTFHPTQDKTVLNGAIAVERRDVTITKKDQDDKALKDAHFELRKGSQVIATGQTNAQGKLTFEQVAFGDYTLIETQAPAGYKIDEPNGRNITVGEDELNLAPFINTLIKGSVIVTKVDADEPTKTLEGVTFVLKQGDEVKYQIKTNQDGVARFDNVLGGRYTLVETEALEDYILSTETKEVEITTNGQVLDLGTITNSIRKGNITTKYLNEDNIEIQQALVQENLPIKTTYTTLRPDEITHDNKRYRLDVNQLPDNATGVVTETPTTVVYRYKLIKGDVTTTFVNEEGENLQTPDIQAGLAVGSTYKTSRPDEITHDNKRYRLDSNQLPDNATGVVTETPTTVVYRYQLVEHKIPKDPPSEPTLPELELGSIKLQFKNKETGVELQAAHTALNLVEVGTDYDVRGHAPALIVFNNKNYRLAGLQSGQEIGQVAEGDTFIVYQYELVEHRVPKDPPSEPTLPELKLGTVSLHFVEQKTGVTLASPILAVDYTEVGTNYDIRGQAPTSISVEGKIYRLVGLQAGNEVGQIKEGDTPITYGYQEVSQEPPAEQPKDTPKNEPKGGVQDKPGGQPKEDPRTPPQDKPIPSGQSDEPNTGLSGKETPLAPTPSNPQVPSQQDYSQQTLLPKTGSQVSWLTFVGAFGFLLTLAYAYYKKSEV